MPEEPEVKLIDGFEEYVIQNAANSLREGKKIKANPKLHKAALKMIKKDQKIDTLVISEG